ncbi:Transposon protein [Arachis hypogaea]|nr:Transposon protein [Arachis hypogaea]
MRNSSLIQFVKQYDNCLGSREQRERRSNAADFHTIITCATKSSIEAQFQQVYTHQKFREVQAKFRGKVNCITRSTNSALGYLSKNVKRRHTHIKSSYDEPVLEPRNKRFDELVFRSQNICEFASEFEELTAILHCDYDNVVVEMQELKAKRKGTCLSSHEDANLESVNELQSPLRVRTGGRPKID